MKHLAAALFLAIASTTGLYAMGSGPVPNSGTTQTQGQPVDIGPQDTLLHRPTPTPAAAATSDSKEKKPLTAILAKDNKGTTNVTVFSSSDPKIYLLWQDGTGVKGDKVRIAWYAEDTGGAIAKNKKITEATQTLTGAGQSGASYIEKPNGGFPAGKYRVDLYGGTKLAKSLKFTVKK